MNSRLACLQSYPFEKLAQLIHGITPPPGKAPVRLSVGEPQHAAPAFVLEALKSNLAELARYTLTKGSPSLRQAIADWATRRFHLNSIVLDPERHVLPLAGTREGLFSIAQAMIDRNDNAPPIVILPNPFYQIYEGAALLAGAQPFFINTMEENGFRMDFSQVPKKIWDQVQMVYICSPGNPTGSLLSHDDLADLIGLAQQHNFIIASDECYSEIYLDEAKPPVGLLQVANDLGVEDYRHCLAFHSLSKRSNLPGMRSGFVAGDGDVLMQYHLFRTYHGCALPPPTQVASIVAWNDEAHVRNNRDQYRAKFDAVLKILKPVLTVEKPESSFYLWPKTPQDDKTFARELYARENVLTLPGSFLSRTAEGVDPGQNRVRMALVSPLPQCIEAAQRIRNYVESL